LTAPTVLVVEHEAGAPSGWLGDELMRAGCRLEVHRPYGGDPLPTDLAGVDGVVVLGGAVASWDDTLAPWLPDTRALIRKAELAGVPVLGICLGHQLATRALGGEVGRNPSGTTLAVLPVSWSEDARTDPLLADLVDMGRAVHWNSDVVSALPDGARTLATSPDGAVQAARLGEHVWGVQFHPEAGPSIVERWVREDGAPYVDAGYDLDGFLADVRERQDELARGCATLARSFVRVLGAQ
jgi:GMP synthase (glutamine-hydrolysing)